MPRLSKLLRPRGLLRIARRQYERVVQSRSDSTRFGYDGLDVLRCTIGYNEYGAYCVPLSSQHRPAARRILAGQVWEPETLAYIERTGVSGDIVHAGTYFGDFLPLLSRACADRGTVWAFEPNRENFRCAQITIALNGLVNVRLENGALGAERSIGQMRIADARGRSLGGASAVLEGEGHTGSNSVPIRLLTLDEIIPMDRHVGVVQLDVERYETQALMGARGILKRCRPLLILENLPEASWLTEHLEPLGYRFVGKVNANSILAPKPSPGPALSVQAAR